MNYDKNISVASDFFKNTNTSRYCHLELTLTRKPVGFMQSCCADDVRTTYVILQWNLTQSLILMSSAHHLHEISTPKIFPVK